MSRSDLAHAPGAAPANGHRRWPAWFATALAVLVLTVMLAVMLGITLSAGLLHGLAGLAGLMPQGLQDGLHVTVNGEPWAFGLKDLGDLSVLLAGAGLIVTLLVLLVALPLLMVVAVVLAVLLAVGLSIAGLALGLGGALFAVLATAALALSPLWLLVLLLWWALRRKTPPGAAPGTTMPT